VSFCPPPSDKLACLTTGLKAPRGDIRLSWAWVCILGFGCEALALGVKPALWALSQGGDSRRFPPYTHAESQGFTPKTVSTH